MSVRKRPAERSLQSRLSNAILKSDILNTRELLNQGANPDSKYEGIPLIFYASLPNLRLLIERGANIDIVNKNGLTLLNRLCQRYRFNIENIEIIEAIRFLLEKGAEINLPDVEGDTPLHNICSFSMEPQIARLLLQYGADVNVKNNNGETPLHCVALNQNDDFPNQECAQVLLIGGADPLITSSDGKTASEIAEQEHRPDGLIQMLKSAEEKRLVAAQHVAIRMGDRHGQVMPSSVARHISNFLRPSKTYKNAHKQTRRNAGEDVNMLNAPAPVPAPAHQHWQNHQFNYQDPANFNLMGGRRRKARSHRRRTHRSKGRR